MASVLGFQFEPRKKTVSESSWETYDSSSEEEGVGEDRRENVENWCRCNRCSVMSSTGFLEESECVCCHEIDAADYFSLNGMQLF